MWLVDEHRLGRVGALKWSAGACATSILVLAMTTRVKALFSAVSLLVLYSHGEREKELVWRLFDDDGDNVFTI